VFFRCVPAEINELRKHPKGGVYRMSILWIILIVVLVLALLGFFSRGYW
jgi:uncharacterized membrane protein (DUF2068 family)